ncbi:2-phospho-L-lactate guanylyltransferase [Streptomyces boninensis]|uniref:2-phospho-L-lactate guanylyltransferase n=1 Tax=Streptomyces boninensis TaxID=2039455 RepID=UPI003B20E064
MPVDPEDSAARRGGFVTAEAGWSLLIPLKRLGQAKTRLADAASDELRPALALAFALDTVAAALACDAVRDVTVVTDDPVAGERLAALGAFVAADAEGGGLNAALVQGAAFVRARRPDAPVAALNADLPALRAAELGVALGAAGAFVRAFLADAEGVGTTLLTAASGVALNPAFGGPSRARHRASGAREIVAAGVASVRRDVDTAADLRAALALGVGPYTSVAAAELRAAR